MPTKNITEAATIKEVADTFYKGLAWTQEIGGAAGKIDFAVLVKQTPSTKATATLSAEHDTLMQQRQQYTLWAEAKSGTHHDIYKSFVQLILTIGRNRMHFLHQPPKYLGAFDAEKSAFIEYHKVQDVFFQSNINWNAPASKHDSEQFQQLMQQLDAVLHKEAIIFYYAQHKQELRDFILANLKQDTPSDSKILIDRNNFIKVFSDWQQQVMPCIMDKWHIAEQFYIYPADFYLADLLSENDTTVNAKDLLYVQLCKDHYEIELQDDSGLQLGKNYMRIDFINKTEYEKFWSIYKRPPLKEFWDHMVAHRDLLLPFKARERKGAFFTPPRWAHLAHDYIAKTLGENWQQEYYVWDCAAGSGNLLEGLTNEDNLWASTIDKPDVAIMGDRIENKNLKMWRKHVFQFDFLNDDILPKSKGGKLPDELYNILTNPEKRKKLLFFINPPYGEAGTARARTQGIGNKAGIKFTKTNDRFKEKLGACLNEKYVQFFTRIHEDMPDCKLAAFVTSKYICGISMKKFRAMWKARYCGGFATPATTHENCSGDFPICFFMWDLNDKQDFPAEIVCDVFNGLEENCAGTKSFCASDDSRINDWIRQYRCSDGAVSLGTGICPTPSVEKDNYCYFAQQNITDHPFAINDKNVLQYMVYFAVRHCIVHKWVNDNDQYFHPNAEWEQDLCFQNDCVVFTLFDNQNKVKHREGKNYWIPYDEHALGLVDQLESRFMSDYIAQRKRECGNFSQQAENVLNAGLDLWKYYLSHKNVDINASFYDIREYFQGRNGNRMNNKSQDERYNMLIGTLRQELSLLAQQIEKKVYLYGFLK